MAKSKAKKKVKSRKKTKKPTKSSKKPKSKSTKKKSTKRSSTKSKKKSSKTKKTGKKKAAKKAKKTGKKPKKKAKKKKSRTKKTKKKTEKRSKSKANKKTGKGPSLSIEEPEKKKRKGRAKPKKQAFKAAKPTVLEREKAEKSEVLKKMDKLKNHELEKSLLKEEDKKAQKKKEKAEDKVEHSEKEPKDERTPAQKFKSFMIYFLSIIVIIIITGIVITLFGLKDLRDDSTYLVVVDHNGEPSVGTLYNVKNKTHENLNTEGYPETSDPKDTYEYAVYSEEGPSLEIDRVLIINHNSFERISSTTGSRFKDNTITVDEMTRYFSDVRNLPSSMRATGKPEWQIESEMLGNWMSAYHKNVWLGEEGHTSLLKEYRRNNIKITPTNNAMFMIKLCPVEKIIEWM